MMRDIDYPQLAVGLLLCCLVVGLFWGLSTSGVAYDPYNYDWDGGSDLRERASMNGTEATVALSTNEYDAGPAGESAAVVLDPGTGYSADERARIASFVSQGGTLLVATETNESSAFLADLGLTVQIDGRPVRDDQYNLNAAAFPQAINVSSHPVVDGVDALTLNHGTVLDPGAATPLVNTSTVAYLDENRNEELDATERLAARPVAAVQQVGDGEVIVVSDASVFTNAMLDERGNAQLLRNVVAGHERVVLDYSQQGSLPPLSYTYLVIQTAPLLQVLAGLAGIAMIAVWGRVGSRRRITAAWERIRGEQTERTAPGDALTAVDSETLSSYLSRQHPEWDDERVKRVTETILSQRAHDDDGRTQAREPDERTGAVSPDERTGSVPVERSDSNE
jgi:hypothetical protein